MPGTEKRTGPPAVRNGSALGLGKTDHRGVDRAADGPVGRCGKPLTPRFLFAATHKGRIVPHSRPLSPR